MKLYKLMSAFFLVLFCSSFAFSEGFFERNGEYNYYVNNPTPIVDVFIRVPVENLVVKDATLIFNGEEKFLDLVDEIVVSQTQEYKKSIKLSEFENQGAISEDDEVFFKLNVVKQVNGNKIKSSGDPVEFNIILDQKAPVLVSPNSDSVQFSYSDEFNFKFSEKISNFIIKKSDGTVILKRPESSKLFEDEFSNIVKFSFSEGQVVEGENPLVVEFEDFAGNKVTKNINFVFKGDPLSVKLLTKKDSSSLNYHYEKENKDFFNSKIQYGDNEFDLTIETNKRAVCYFSNTFLNFVKYENILDKSVLKQFSSTDDLVHKYKLNGDNIIWVACQDKNFKKEVVYLNDVLDMKDDLVRLEKYNFNAFSISKFFPQAIVSSTPFSVEVSTTQDTICQFKVGSGNLRTFDNSVDYKNHIQNNLELSNGNYNIDVECYDRLYNIEKESKNVKVDLNYGPRVINEGDVYTDSNSAPVTLKFSEEAFCVGSSVQITADSFNTTTSLTGVGLEKQVIPGNLAIGDNPYYIYCQKDGQLILSEINIVYDPNAPQIKDLFFVNNGYESDFLSSLTGLKYKLTYESLIPVDQFEAEIKYSDRTEFKNFSSETGTYNENLEDASSFKIRGKNILGKYTNYLEKKIEVDTDKPVLTITKLLDTVTFNCIDKSGCSEILYGFSQTPLDCSFSTKYEDEGVEFNDNNYVCAKAFDGVGNFEEVRQSLTGEFDFGSGGFELNNETNSTVDDFDSGSDSDSNDNNIDDNPFTPSDGGDTTGTESNGLVIAALVLVLIGGLSGGGYYAYREGYLDEQLEKFGIFRNNNSKPNEVYRSVQDVPKTSTGTQTKSYNPISKVLPKKTEKKTGYDRNLKKLHSFIDSTLNKGDDVFDSFGSTSKGKTSGYEDTLIKSNKEFETKKKKEQEFTLKPQNKLKTTSQKTTKSKASIEKEAEEFENYFKKKDSKKVSNKKE